jgi:heterodisulfide reductase subunit C1
VETFDLKNEAFPGQRESSADSSVEINNVPKLFNAPWFRRDADLSEEDRRKISKYLEGLTDEEIVAIYYLIRDEKVIWDDGLFYPNIQVLFGTPFEREKDRREIKVWNERKGESEITMWYREAKERPCVWWLENHIIARHSLGSCMSCGNCTSLCPAAEFFDYNPRVIMETVQEKNEETLVELLKSETLWYCSQCGSCKTKCPRKNNPFGLISSLRQLSQIKGFHVESVRGRQQYAGRHLWGGNLWNRACSLYFRNPLPQDHRDFGPRFEAVYDNIEGMFRKIGACPDMEGSLSGRKVRPETLDEVRKIWQSAGVLFLWDQIEQAGQKQADELGLNIDEYHDKVKTEG